MILCILYKHIIIRSKIFILFNYYPNECHSFIHFFTTITSLFKTKAACTFRYIRLQNQILLSILLSWKTSVSETAFNFLLLPHRQNKFSGSGNPQKSILFNFQKFAYNLLHLLLFTTHIEQTSL